MNQEKKRRLNQISNEDDCEDEQTLRGQTNRKNAKGAGKPKRRLKRDAGSGSDYEDRVEKGGSSQDQFESDFIDDGDDDEKCNNSDDSDYTKKNKKLKGNTDHQQLSDCLPDDDESDEHFIGTDESCDDEIEIKQHKQKKGKTQKAPVKQIQQESDGEEDDESEIYPQLTIPAENHRELNIDYKLYPKDNRYYLPGDFSLPKEHFDNLFDHQKVGIQWLYDLWKQKKGGLLGDDMGLGKTVQIASYLKGLFDANLIKKVLIVVPATMKSYWENELNKWCNDCCE